MTNQEFFEKYPEIIVYDFEVFPRYWCMCYLSAESPEFPQFVEAQGKKARDDMRELETVWEPNQEKVWVGYNSNHYDRYIFGAILNCKTMEIIHTISKDLIAGESVRIYKVLVPEMRSYDTGDKFHSLKQFEGFMGHSIEESNVPFDKPDELSETEKASVIKYCSHDVLETLEVLKRKISDYEAHRNIIKTFQLPPEKICLSKAQLTAEVLGCGYVSDQELEALASEEWENEIKPCVALDKYEYVKDWYKTAANYRDKQKLQTDIMGVPHVFGLGGAHGAVKKYHKAGGNIWHIDVTSYYPSIMIQHDLLTRRAKDKKKFQKIYNTRVQLKAQGKKKEQAPYKIILNSTFGITNYRYSKAYDPKMNHDVCINGQLMILMLLEMLEGKCRLIQSNTDGIIIDAQGFDFDEIRRTCDKWCEITKMSVGYDEIDEIWQKDVNNYLFRFAGSGNYEAKGAYVKFNNDLDNDMAIINEAVRAGLIEGSVKAADRCIDECKDLIAFQKIVRLSSKYKYAYFGDTKIENHKCFRVFAVTRGNETIYKQRDVGATKEKFGNTPDRAALVFGDLSDPELKAFGKRKFDISRIDRKYYKTLARKRFNEFGGGLS